jgi:hypothetical protein
MTKPVKLKEGDRVREDLDWFDKGNKGTVIAVDNDCCGHYGPTYQMLKIEFDNGGRYWLSRFRLRKLPDRKKGAV